MLSHKITLGIDFGNSKSCMAHMVGDRVHMVTDEQGEKFIPSVLFLDPLSEPNIIIGSEAKEMRRVEHPHNCVYNVKRLFGVMENDRSKDCLPRMPFLYRLEEDKRKNLVVLLDDGNELKKFTIEDIYTLFFGDLYARAKKAFDKRRVDQVVVTVPPFADDRYRTMVKDAATLAGFKVLRVINESTASCVAYEMNKLNCPTPRYLLCVDFGAASLQLAIMNVEDGIFEILTTSRNYEIGGDVIDDNMMNYCCEHFMKIHKKDLRQNPRALLRLRNACERAKLTLFARKTYVTNVVNMVNISVNSILDGLDLDVTISRAKFNHINSSIYAQLSTSIDNIFKEQDSNISVTPSMIQDVVIVGGCCNIPQVQEIIKKFFPEALIRNSIDPQEVVARGAAIIADTLSNPVDHGILVTLLCVLSIGINVEGKMSKIIHRNMTYPTTKSTVATLPVDPDGTLTVTILEGERIRSDDNWVLNMITFDNLDYPGMVDVQVKISVSYDEVITVEATLLATGETKVVVISETDQPSITRYDIEEMLRLAEQDANFQQISHISYSGTLDVD